MTHCDTSGMVLGVKGSFPNRKYCAVVTIGDSAFASAYTFEIDPEFPGNGDWGFPVVGLGRCFEPASAAAPQCSAASQNRPGPTRYPWPLGVANPALLPRKPSRPPVVSQSD
jgi:hypothetical protein